MTTIGLRAVAAVALLCVGPVGCGPDGGGRAAPPPRAPRPVELVDVGTAGLPTRLAVTGVLAPQEELVLGLEVAGRLETLPVDVGDVVERGTVVAALAPRELELAVARSQAQIVAAEARLGVAADGELDTFAVDDAPTVREASAVVTEARLHRDRVQSLVEQRMQSASELETAAAALAVAESRVQRARDEVRTWLAEARLRRIELLQAQKQLNDATVRAPWTGRVAARHAAAGQVLAAGAPVVTLLRVDPLRLQLRVPDRLASDVAIDQRVEFTVDGGGEREHVGRVVRAGPAIQRGDRTRLVEAEVANGDGALLPGAFCRAHIVTAAAVPVAVVPTTAVVSFAGVDRVFTVGPADAAASTGRGRPAVATPGGGAAGPLVAHGVLVELGRPHGDLVEVRRGLEPGTRIVRDATGLSPQTPVTVR